MPKSVLEFLEEGRKALLADKDELPQLLDDRDASNALIASKLLDEAIKATPMEKAARLYAYDVAMTKHRAGDEAASSTPSAGEPAK
jgi:hypothetical protein